MQFLIPSNDPARLEQAIRVAEGFVQPYIRDDIVGIVFLGAIVRGYFDRHADIDIAIFAADGARISPPAFYSQVEGFEVQCFWSEYPTAVGETWNMARRWAFTRRRIYHDPRGLTAQLLQNKVPLTSEEKRWLVMEGMANSEWCVNGLTELWIERGSLTSAHEMIGIGVELFYQALFALNDELVPAWKWHHYCAMQLPVLPPRFSERIEQVLLLKALSLEEIERRKQVFMGLWQDILPRVEEQLGMPFQEFKQLV